jgi:tetratricopeptide (TPR) repeat protein
MRRTSVLVVALGLLTAALAAQRPTAGPTADRERAAVFYRSGLDSMRREAFEEAVKLFRSAIDIDPEFELAYYGLGRAYMGLKRYTEAIPAYTKCRSLYEAFGGKRFANQQDAQRYRRDRIREIDELILEVQKGPQTIQAQDRLRQLQNYRRELGQVVEREDNITIENTVPSFVSLALGSAYFRAERFDDAEREYKAAIKADPKTGEAHNNLAVVYLVTDRPRLAEEEVRLAERAGYKVNPALKDDIRKALR